MFTSERGAGHKHRGGTHHRHHESHRDNISLDLFKTLIPSSMKLHEYFSLFSFPTISFSTQCSFFNQKS